MGKHDKTNPTFKWARMLHLLDYHRWHYVKKVLAHKKPNEGKNGTETDSIALGTCEHHPYATNEVTYISSIEEHATDQSSSSKCSPSPSSPRTKSSRAARIRKMIAKEMTKRRGRHRRSSTCPAVSEIAATDSVHDHQLTSEKLSRNSSVDQRDKKCGLCNTMQIECQLGERKQVGDQGDHDHLDHINMLLQEIPDEAINQLSFDNKNIARTTSSQHSKEFLDAMDVLSINKQFFLRVLDDPSSSLRHHFLAQQSSNKRKSLVKSGTFPVTHGPLSSMTDSFPTLLKPKHKSYAKETQTSSNQAQLEKPSINSHDNRVVGKRFKDLRQKLKHVIKESRKERRRIAMDAVLHRVPYGQKAVLDESRSIKDSPCVSTCESDLLASPCSSIKDGRKRNRRSPSLDGSLERYCQLFETTTSFNRVEPNKIMDTTERSRLKVMDENSSKRALGRIFSSPDLQVFLSHWTEDFDGHLSSRTPNRDTMSFNVQKMQEVALNMDLKSGKLSSRPAEDDTSKKDLEDVSNEDISIDEPSKEEFQTPNSLEVAPCDDNTSVTTAQTITELASMPKFDDQTILVCLEEKILEDHDAGSTEEHQETSNESPTFSCTKVDDDQVETSLTETISPTLHPVKVSIEDEAEFNYVKDILHLSGYSGSQLLGTWYSSDQPVNPSVFVELESGSLLEPTTYSPSEDGCTNTNSHLLLFDLINEILLSIYERSVSYWSVPLSSCSRMHPMPKGYHVLEEVWASINWYMACSTTPQLHSCLDYIATRDLAKDDGWMNLQFDAECVGLEVDDLIFDDLLTELLS